MRTSYHHGDLRRALIQSGLEILAGEGIRALSLRNVARRAGVSQAAPYRHFKDMESLVAAIAEQGFLRLAEKLRTVENRHAGDARELFYQTGLAYVQFARENPDSMRVMFRSPHAGSEADFPALKEAAGEAFNYLIDLVEACQHAGLARAGHPMPLALGAWSMIHGLSMLLIDHCIPPEAFQGADEETMILGHLDIILQGWQPASYGQ